MKIKKLTANNFKGRSFSDELAAVTLYTGANSAGKSSRLEALALALLGYVPGYSRKPSDIHGLFASGSCMSAGYESDSGGAVRRYEQRGGAVKYSGPEASEVPAVLLDPEAYFGLSGPERAKFLFAASGAAKEVDCKKLANTVAANLKNIRLEENTEQTEAAVSRLVEWVAQRQKCGPQEWLENLAADAKDKLRLAKQSVVRLEKTVQGNAQAALAEDPAPADAEHRLAEARQALESAQAEESRLETELSAARREYNATLAAAGSAVDTAQTESEIAQIDASLALLSEATAEQPSDREEFDNWQARAAFSLKIEKDLSSLLDKLGWVDKSLAHAKSETTCPACGQSTVEIKKSIVAALEKEREERLDASNKVAEAFNAARDEALAARKAFEAKNAAVVEYGKNTAKVRQLNERKRSLSDALAANAKAAEAKAKLPAMQSAGVELKQKLEFQKAFVGEKRAVVLKWDLAAKRLTAERAEAAQRARVAEECAAARAERDVLKEFCDMLATLQAELVEKAIGPVVDRMNRLCAPVLPRKVAFRDGELVFGDWSHKTASDSEKLLIYAALSVALAADSPLKFCAVGRLESFDGAKKLALAKLLSGLVAAGDLDQAVLVEVDARPEIEGAGRSGPRWWAALEGEGFKVVEL